MSSAGNRGPGDTAGQRSLLQNAGRMGKEQHNEQLKGAGRAAAGCHNAWALDNGSQEATEGCGTGALNKCCVVGRCATTTCARARRARGAARAGASPPQLLWPQKWRAHSGAVSASSDDAGRGCNGARQPRHGTMDDRGISLDGGRGLQLEGALLHGRHGQRFGALDGQAQRAAPHALAQHAQRTRHAKQHGVEVPARPEEGVQGKGAGQAEASVTQATEQAAGHKARQQAAWTRRQPAAARPSSLLASQPSPAQPSPAQPSHPASHPASHSLLGDAVVLQQHAAVGVHIGVRVLHLQARSRAGRARAGRGRSAHCTVGSGSRGETLTRAARPNSNARSRTAPQLQPGGRRAATPATPAHLARLLEDVWHHLVQQSRQLEQRVLGHVLLGKARLARVAAGREGRRGKRGAVSKSR